MASHKMKLQAKPKQNKEQQKKNVHSKYANITMGKMSPQKRPLFINSEHTHTQNKRAAIICVYVCVYMLCVNETNCILIIN